MNLCCPAPACTLQQHRTRELESEFVKYHHHLTLDLSQPRSQMVRLMKRVSLHQWTVSVHKVEMMLAYSLAEEGDMAKKSRMLPAWRARYSELAELLVVPVVI